MRRADLAPAGICNAIGRANVRDSRRARRDRARIRALGCGLHLPGDVAGREHRQLLDHRGARPEQRSGSFAGHQLDVRFRFWLVPSLLRAELNAVVLMSRFLETAPNAPATGDTHYVAAALTRPPSDRRARWPAAVPVLAELRGLPMRATNVAQCCKCSAR